MWHTKIQLFSKIRKSYYSNFYIIKLSCSKSENVGNSYVNNVLGVGAAMSALEIVLNYPDD